MKFGLAAVCFFAVFLYSSNAPAQSQQEDSIFYQSALTHTLSVYYNQLDDQSQIYNGSFYPGFDFLFKGGSPYFLSEKASSGSVVYDSVFYPDLTLIYEDFRQYLVVIDQAFKLKLVNEKVSSFTIAGHYFENLPLDGQHMGIPSAGFYEILYPGRSMVLKHANKKTREVLTITEGVSRFIDVTDNYYIKMGNVFVEINNKRALLNAMQNRRKEIQRFMRKNKLNYKADKDNALIQIATYYDQVAN